MLDRNVVHIRAAGTHVFCTKDATYIDAVEAALKSAHVVPSAVRRELRSLIENGGGRVVYISTARIARNVYHSAYVIMLLQEYIKTLLDDAVVDIVTKGRNTHRKTLIVVDREKALQKLGGYA
jgi:rRNA-processing protein FCF1